MKNQSDPDAERKLALKLLRLLKIPYNEELGYGPSWDGALLHSKEITPENLAHEAGHWLVAGEHRAEPNWGLGPDLDYKNRVRTIVKGTALVDYELLASYAGIFMGVRMGMDIHRLMETVNIDLDPWHDGEMGDHLVCFTQLQSKNFLPYQLETFRKVKTERGKDIPLWVSVAVWG